MAYEDLRESVWKANLDIVEAGLVVLTWGNASGVDRESDVMAIKPSGVAYEALEPEDIVIISLTTAEVVDGDFKPSSDTPTHLVLYEAFPEVAGIVHTHSNYAVAWAQAERPIPCFGTTHADHFFGAVPVTRRMHTEEIRHEYEKETGNVIVERFRDQGLDPIEIPGVLVAGHGPFVWGKTVQAAVDNAIVLESVGEMALNTIRINPDVSPIDQALLDKHFLRKHGKDAYYGQG